MSCDLSSGRTLGCRDSIGGIRNVYFVSNGDMGAYTFTANEELDAIATVTAAKKYELDNQSSTFDEVINVSEENGTVFYEQTIVLNFRNLTTADIKELKVIGQGRFQMFVEDNNLSDETTTVNGRVYLVGAINGATLTAGNIGRGQSYGDQNGFSLTFTARESRAAYVLEASATADALAGVTNLSTAS